MTQETIEQAARVLAVYVGPIARVVVKKAVAQAADRRQSYEILAESIASDSDRARFLQELGAAS